jgi:ribosome-binding factor A
MGGKRTDRLASQLMREIADILRKKLSDPRLTWVSVTHAEVSKDMMEAKVFVQTLEEGEKQEEALSVLRHATGYIKGELGRRLNWRTIPNLQFKVDDEFEKNRKVLEIIDKLALERDENDGRTETGS